MALLPVEEYRKTRGIHRIGTRANQPAANTCLEGTYYYVTDEKVLERSTGVGNTWVSNSAPVDTPVTLAGAPDYITIAGQVITRGLVDLTTDVSGILPLANLPSTWVNVPYNAADFHTNGTSVWTVQAGDVTDFSYILLNSHTAIVNFRIETTSFAAGTGDRLQIDLPAILTPVKPFQGPYLLGDDGNFQTGFFFNAVGGIARIDFLKLPLGTAFTVSTNNTSIYAMAIITI